MKEIQVNNYDFKSVKIAGQSLCIMRLLNYVIHIAALGYMLEMVCEKISRLELSGLREGVFQCHHSQCYCDQL